MKEYLKDNLSRIIGYTQNENGKIVIYDYLGRRLGYYDGRCTYNNLGKIIGYGNLLALFIKDKINL